MKLYQDLEQLFQDYGLPRGAAIVEIRPGEAHDQIVVEYVIPTGRPEPYTMTFNAHWHPVNEYSDPPIFHQTTLDLGLFA